MACVRAQALESVAFDPSFLHRFLDPSYNPVVSPSPCETVPMNPHQEHADAPQTEPVSATAAGSDTETARPEGGPQTPVSAEERIADLETRLAAMSDAYLRAKAESENTRRRAEEETSKARKFAIESFAESLLPVRDSLEAALAIQAATNQQLLEGVQATLRQLSQALERNKVAPIEPPAGTKFDPHHHQAISMVPAEQEPNTVVSVLQKGYLIADRVLRPALVTVVAPR